ncbi:MAG TPA: hypothetical protein VJC21_05815 [Candidatus Nanoarchaeia archaeon]|nr:hypothetical protein [Candidatus Nanoarchaeia archaeon]
MKWKEFFRPQLEKIILFLALLIVPMIDMFSGVNIATKITNVLFFPAKFFYAEGFRMPRGDLGLPPSLSWTIASVIIGLVWGYVLSCLIIFVYNKLKK